MTDLKDHAQKIERIAQALTAEGIGRDVAVSTALLRYPVPSTTGVDAELAALRPTDDGVRPASGEAKHLPPRNTALFIEREVGGVRHSSMLAANVGKWTRGDSVRQGDRPHSFMWRTTISGRIKDANDLGLLRATENVRFLDSGDQQVLAGRVACISLIPMSPDTLEWVIEVDHESVDGLGGDTERDAAFKRNADTRAALFSALGREDSTLTTPQLVAALVNERDLWRSAHTGTVANLKRAHTEHEATKTDHAGLREHYKARGDAMDKATKFLADALGLLQPESRYYVDVAKSAATEIERIKANYTVIADAQKQVRAGSRAWRGAGSLPDLAARHRRRAKLKKAQAEIENRKAGYEQSLAGLRAQTEETADVLRGIVSDPTSQAPLVELAQRVKAMASWTQGTWMQQIWSRIVGTVPAPGSELGTRRFKLIEVTAETTG